MRIPALLPLVLLLAGCQQVNEALDLPTGPAPAPVATVADTGGWPQAGVAAALRDASIGVPASLPDGSSLEVTHEYQSALGGTCRVYMLTGSQYLACGGPNWKPARKL